MVSCFVLASLSFNGEDSGAVPFPPFLRCRFESGQGATDSSTKEIAMAGRYGEPDGRVGVAKELAQFVQRNSAGQDGCRSTVANEMNSRFRSIADRANLLADDCERSLNSVSKQSPSEPEKCVPDPLPWMPPLFSDYRDSSMSISVALDRIEAALRRLEI